MRILHVIDTLDVGGAEKVLIALANGFAAQHEVAICCVTRIGGLARELDSRVQAFSLGRGPGNDYLLPWRLARHIRRTGYDVVHTHNWSVFLEGGIAGVLARVPVLIHTVHGSYQALEAGPMQRLKRSLRHWLERRVARRFRHVVAVSDSIREQIPAVVGIEPERLTTVHNGVTNGAACTQAAARGLTFITVGRFDAIKNHELMIQAFAKVAAQFPTAKLMLVGDGPHRAPLEALVDTLGLESKVELTGFRSDVAHLLTQADVFLMSSRYEGVSIALLEAMRAGLPAVATRVGGIPETVIPDQTGLLVASEDTEGFAAAMSALAASPELRRQFGTAAREFQRREFSSSAMLERYGALYGSTHRPS
jgi:glycosyltransferase involved in cell wall biosynthesis